MRHLISDPKFDCQLSGNTCRVPKSVIQFLNNSNIKILLRPLLLFITISTEEALTLRNKKKNIMEIQTISILLYGRTGPYNNC